MSASPPSPISGVPLEVLTYIIRNTLSFPLDEVGRREFQALRSVNSRWRTYCFSDPQLWSSVDLTAEVEGERKISEYRSYGTRLKNWFKRAGSLPLQLDLSAGAGMYGLNAAGGEKIIDCIRCYRDRWEVLNLYTRSGWLEKVWSEEARSCPTTGNWPSLQHLEIPFLSPSPGIETVYGVLEPLPPLAQMPNLQRLFLTIGRLMHDIPVEAFGHAKLREISLRLSNLTTPAVALLRNFPNASKVSVSVDVLSQPVSIHVYPSLTLNQLTRLRLRLEPEEMLNMLQCFQCPTLQELILSVNDRVSPDYRLSQRIIPFIDTHRYTLTTLQISSGTPGLVDAEYQAILWNPSPSCIEHLQLDAWPYAEETPFTILPKLRTIAIGQFRRHRAQDLYYAEHTNSLLSFAERRHELKNREWAGNVNRIETISMVVRWYMAKFPWERVEALRAKGINVIARYL